MPRFFVDNITETTEIIGADAAHISRSLRMRVDDDIVLCDKTGYDFLCKIESFTESSVFCRLIEKVPSISEPNIKLTLYQALPKLDKFETIIQKSVELGVTKIVPVITARCVSRPDEKGFFKKLDRYEKISLEAAKQSGRGIVPEITGIINYKTAISEMKDSDIGLICYEKGGEILNNVGLSAKKSVSVLVGSEGGFDSSEAEYAKNNGIIPVTLGNRILRCETAPLAVMSIIMNLTGNM